MQFIPSGPDVPDALLQAHEEGRVVFFCGAGISYPAGLPGFEGLVMRIYELTGAVTSEIEREALVGKQFDAALDLLERRLPGQRLVLRRALEKALKPNTRRKGAVDTQSALLRLARSRDGALRLVTTNFDRVFHVAARRTKQAFQSYTAPMLPIPKNSRWDGLVYLHGLLPERSDDTALSRLVITSGDFGSAYLTERWAARFVSELFRNYVVCFIGYSINDPVLRYMMDALAADRLRGEITPQAWAFGDCHPDEEEKKTNEWEAKGVTPILYTVPTDSHDHSVLHKTLHAWADTYRDGVQGKEAIVVKHALARPQDSTIQDNFVGRMLWALSDKSGLPAKRFADFNPTPSLDWLLEPFTHACFGHSDLVRFGVPPHAEVDAKLRFSLIHRPAPYHYAPRMALASSGENASQWDLVMMHLGRWLVRHLDDPRLIIWIANFGGKIDHPWISLIDSQLDRIASMEQAGHTTELEELRLHAPKAIPSPLMRKLWRLLLNGRVKSMRRTSNLSRWKGRLSRDGFSTTLRLELREYLTPKVVLRKPFRWWEDDELSTDGHERLKQLVDWEVVLATEQVHSQMSDLVDGAWKLAQEHLLEEFQHLLRDALDLLSELGEARELHDRSHWDLPSITPHWQNRAFRDWVSLIELLRDAWLGLRLSDDARATQVAQRWFEIPYPTFKRLALFAASQENCITPEQWVGWLLADNAWWLWSADTGREVNRLLVLQGSRLCGTIQERLEAAILEGPPRKMYRDDLQADAWQSIESRGIWLRLAKLRFSGLVLDASASTRLDKLSEANPHWQLASNERDEFSHWMSGTGDPDFEINKHVDIAPRKRAALVQWLKLPPSKEHPDYEDTWRDVCRTRFFHSLLALRDLALAGEWPVHRWREALQAWADDSVVTRSWRHAAPLVQTMPDALLKQVDHALAWWIEASSKRFSSHTNILLDLCHRLLALPLEAGDGLHATRECAESYDAVGAAINHPIGNVTQALLNAWFKRSPNDNDMIPFEFKKLFTKLCDVQVDRFRHGRVLLGSQLIAFFRVDRFWTEQYLLPLFDWRSPLEAKGVWEGFLWSPRLYQPLLAAFKPQFLDTVNHYALLAESRQQFAVLLTYAALGPTDGFTVEDFRSAIGMLPQEGLEESAQALVQALEGAADQRSDYWKNRAQPFWQQIWPKSRNLATPRIAESLARLAIAADEQFPAAIAAVSNWLKPIEHPFYIVGQLKESGLCSRYPTDSLLLLSSLIDKQEWVPPELLECLKSIRLADAALAHTPAYVRLREHFESRKI